MTTAVLERPDVDLEPAEPEADTPDGDGAHKRCQLTIAKPLVVVLGPVVIVVPEQFPCHATAEWLGSWMCSHGRDQTVRACAEHHDYLVEHPEQLRDGNDKGSNPTILWDRI